MVAQSDAAEAEQARLTADEVWRMYWSLKGPARARFDRMWLDAHEREAAA